MTLSSRNLFLKQSIFEVIFIKVAEKMIFNKGTFGFSLWWEACLFLKIRCYVTNAPSSYYTQEDNCFKLAYTKPIMGNHKPEGSKSISPCSHFPSLPFQINIIFLSSSLFLFLFRESTINVLKYFNIKRTRWLIRFQFISLPMLWILFPILDRRNLTSALCK